MTPDRPTPESFRLALAPGMAPTSWMRTWRQRLPQVTLDLLHPSATGAYAAVLDGHADAALLRLPVDLDLVYAIPLFTEVTVVVMPRDHPLATLETLTADDLMTQTLVTAADDVLGWADPPGDTSALPVPATTGEAVELVAAGVALLVVPMSLARLHHRRDLTYRPLTDAPQSQAALAWSRERVDDPLIEELIGIIRGRTANSSRGSRAPTQTPSPDTREGRRTARKAGRTAGTGGRSGTSGRTGANSRGRDGSRSRKPGGGRRGRR